MNILNKDAKIRGQKNIKNADINLGCHFSIDNEDDL